MFTIVKKRRLGARAQWIAICALTVWMMGGMALGQDGPGYMQSVDSGKRDSEEDAAGTSGHTVQVGGSKHIGPANGSDAEYQVSDTTAVLELSSVSDYLVIDGTGTNSAALIVGHTNVKNAHSKLKNTAGVIEVKGNKASLSLLEYSKGLENSGRIIVTDGGVLRSSNLMVNTGLIDISDGFFKVANGSGSNLKIDNSGATGDNGIRINTDQFRGIGSQENVIDRIKDFGGTKLGNVMVTGQFGSNYSFALDKYDEGAIIIEDNQTNTFSTLNLLKDGNDHANGGLTLQVNGGTFGVIKAKELIVDSSGTGGGNNTFTEAITANVTVQANSKTNDFQKDIIGDYTSAGGTNTISGNVGGDFTVTGGTTTLAAGSSLTNGKKFVINGGTVINNKAPTLDLSKMTIDVSDNSNSKIKNNTRISISGTQAGQAANLINAAARGNNGDIGRFTIWEELDSDIRADNTLITAGSIELRDNQTVAKSIQIGGANLAIMGNGANYFHDVTAKDLSVMNNNVTITFTGNVRTNITYANETIVATFAQGSTFQGSLDTKSGKFENSGAMTFGNGDRLYLKGAPGSATSKNTATGSMTFLSGSQFTASTSHTLESAGKITVIGNLYRLGTTDSAFIDLTSTTKLLATGSFVQDVNGLTGAAPTSFELKDAAAGSTYRLTNSGAQQYNYELGSASHFNLKSADYTIDRGLTMRYGSHNGVSNHRITAPNTALDGDIEFTGATATLNVAGNFALREGSSVSYQAGTGNRIDVDGLFSVTGESSLLLEGDLSDVMKQESLITYSPTSTPDIDNLGAYLTDDEGLYRGIDLLLDTKAVNNRSVVYVKDFDSLGNSLGRVIGPDNFNRNTVPELDYLDHALREAVDDADTDRIYQLQLVTENVVDYGRNYLEQYLGAPLAYHNEIMRLSSNTFFNAVEDRTHTRRVFGFYSYAENWRPNQRSDAGVIASDSAYAMAPQVRGTSPSGKRLYTCAPSRWSFSRGGGGFTATNNRGFSLWASYLGNWAKLHNHSNLKGHKFDANGFVLGGEYAVGGFDFGFYGSYIRAGNKINGLATKFDGDILNLALSAGYTHSSGFFARATLGYGHGWNDYEINMIGGGKRDGDYDSDTFTALAELGYVWRLPAAFNIIPSVGLKYTHYHNGGWTDKVAGNPNLINAWYSGDNENTLDIPLAIRVNKIFDFGGSLLTLNGKFGWTLAADRARSRIATGLVGTSGGVTLHGVDPNRNRFNVGGGIGARIGNRVDLNVEYNFEFQSRYRSHSLTAGVGVSF